MIEIRAIAIGLLTALIFAGIARPALAQTPTVQPLYGTSTSDVDKYSTGTTSPTQDFLSDQSDALLQMQAMAAAAPGECQDSGAYILDLSPEERGTFIRDDIESTNITLRVGLELTSVDAAVEALVIECSVCTELCQEITTEDIVVEQPKKNIYSIQNGIGIGLTTCHAEESLWPTSTEVTVIRNAGDHTPLQRIKYYHCRIKLRIPHIIRSVSPGRGQITPGWAWAKDGTELIVVLEGEIDAAVTAPSLIFEPPPAVETTSSVETSPAVISPTISAPTILSPPTTQ